MVKRALIIGINYTNTHARLNKSITNAYSMKNFLKDNCGFVDANIRLLTDNDILPTRDNIISNISWLISGVLPGDNLVFYYSGHGSYLKDTSGDETDRRDDLLVPINFQMITDDWLFANLVQNIPQSVSLWAFIDSSYSGTIFDLKYNFRSLCALKQGRVRRGLSYNSNQWTNSFLFRTENSTDVQGNVYVLSGTTDRETFIQGAFTPCLLDCLKQNLDNSQQFISGTLKLKDILKQVDAVMEIKGYLQNPQLSTSKSTDLEQTLDL